MTISDTNAIDFLASKDGHIRIELIISDHLGFVAEHQPSQRAAEFIQFAERIVNRARVELEFAHLTSA